MMLHDKRHEVAMLNGKFFQQLPPFCQIPFGHSAVLKNKRFPIIEEHLQAKSSFLFLAPFFKPDNFYQLAMVVNPVNPFTGMFQTETGC